MFTLGKQLQELRTASNLSRKEFSERVGIPADTIRSYETGRRRLIAEKFAEIKSKIGYVSSSQGSLRVMIDYLRITFKNVTDLDSFCQQYLYSPLDEFVPSETRAMGYTNLWERGDIWVFDFFDKTVTGNYQITVQMSGKGCRQFELLLEHEGIDWVQALQKMVIERSDMNVTRIDIALDEMYKGYGQEDEQFNLLDLKAKLETGEAILNRIKKWHPEAGNQLSDGERNGLSLYIGSRKSECYFNFYEKRYELARKEGVSVDEALDLFGIWNRYEIRLSQKKANKWVDEFVNGVPLDDLTKGLINSVIDVYDSTNDYGIYLPDKKWQKLFGGTKKLKLSVDAKEFDIVHTIKWLGQQVSPSIKLVEEFDKERGTNYLEHILNGELTPKNEKRLSHIKSLSQKNIYKN